MSRVLDTSTLDMAAKHYAAQFLLPDVESPTTPGRYVAGHAYVMQDFFNFAYRDEHEYLLEKIKGYLGPEAIREFQAEAEEKFTPRTDEAFDRELRDRLAIDQDGNHLPGVIGRVQVSKRVIGKRMSEDGKRIIPDEWPVYAGEQEERVANPEGAEHFDPLPEGANIASNG